MFYIMDVLDLLEANFPMYTFVPNSFKKVSPDNCIAIVLNGGRYSKQVGTPSIQFLVRNTKEELAERVAYELFDFFNYKTNFQLGNVQVVMSKGQQAAPLYTGTDESDRHIYSVNVDLTVSLA
ncbi:minor capsid protein [Weizmannia sp. CD-2023]|uniref:minor capsid protein n=1 Tax=Heyndrickxia TaxID=2837504 RepID=UPI002E1C27E3|nr:minor capsid protein [Weizmannia sp. CD-2023]MED4899712.1 minor capsid protein [Weizmannia sp. CD-2023]